MAFGQLACRYVQLLYENNKEADLVQIVHDLPSSLIPELMRRVLIFTAVEKYEEVGDLLNIAYKKLATDQMSRLYDTCNTAAHDEHIRKWRRLSSEHRIDSLLEGSLSYTPCIEAATGVSSS